MENNGGTWPEQNAVHRWLEKYNELIVDFDMAMELKRAVSEFRIQREGQLRDFVLAATGAIWYEDSFTCTACGGENKEHSENCHLKPLSDLIIAHEHI